MAYCVYKHTFPNGKVYIGKAAEPATKRWCGGLGYEESNREMFIDILKYGWDNIKHEILAENMEEMDALRLERELIETANRKNPRNVYNKVYAIKPDYILDEDRASKTIVDSRYHDLIQRYVGDDWIDFYFDSGMYLSLRYEADRIEVILPPKEGFVAENRTAAYPEVPMTVMKLKEWLWSGDAEFV